MRIVIQSSSDTEIMKLVDYLTNVKEFNLGRDPDYTVFKDEQGVYLHLEPEKVEVKKYDSPSLCRFIIESKLPCTVDNYGWKLEASYRDLALAKQLGEPRDGCRLIDNETSEVIDES